MLLCGQSGIFCHQRHRYVCFLAQTTSRCYHSMLAYLTDSSFPRPGDAYTFLL